MPVTNEVGDLIGTLSTALDRLKAQEDAFEKTVETQREMYKARHSAIEQSIKGLVSAFDDDFQSLLEGVAPRKPELSISDRNLDLVRAHIEKLGSSRQSDISDVLSLNSGTISVALRKLELDGLVERNGKERGSQTWRWIQTVTVETPKERETVLRPGEGVSSGRKVK